MASAWNYNRNVIMITQDSRLLLLFLFFCSNFVLSHDDFSSSKTYSRGLQNIFKVCCKTRCCTSYKMRNCYAESLRRLGDQKMFVGKLRLQQSVLFSRPRVFLVQKRHKNIRLDICELICELIKNSPKFERLILISLLS